MYTNNNKCRQTKFSLSAFLLLIACASPSITYAQTADEAVQRLLLEKYPHFVAHNLKSKIFPLEGQGRGRILIEGTLSPKETLYTPNRKVFDVAVNQVLKTPFEKTVVLSDLKKKDRVSSKQFYAIHRDKGAKQKFLLEAAYAELVTSFRFGVINFEGELKGQPRAKLPPNAVIKGEQSYQTFIGKLGNRRQHFQYIVAQEIDVLKSFITRKKLSSIVNTYGVPTRSNLSLNQKAVYRTGILSFRLPTFTTLDAFTQRFEGLVDISGPFKSNYWPRISDGPRTVAEPISPERYVGECKMYANAPQCYLVVDHPARLKRERGARAKPLRSNYSTRDLEDVLKSRYAFGKLVFKQSKQGPLFFFEHNKNRRSYFVVSE